MRSQLTDANITGIIGTGDWAADYAYHDSGNIASRTIQSSTESFFYNGHQMINADGNTLDYDENGQLTTDASSRTLIYNHDGKLRKAKEGATTLAHLRYDPFGNRIWKDSSTAGERKYIVDIVGDLPVILLEIDASDSSIAKTYIYANSQILAQHTGKYDQPIYFYLHDRLGSVRNIINTSGNVVRLYTYEPFGQVLESGGTLENPYCFAGYFSDDEISQYYCRDRQYDPYIYRFTSRDLVPGEFEEPLTLHAYLYCGDEPVNRIDPTGLWWEITHRQFGIWGWGMDKVRGVAPFDYARLDRDMPPVQNESPYFTRYTRLHYRSRRDVYVELLHAASLSDVRGFEYLMHQWQDSYVHWDRGFRWWRGGHALYDLTHDTSADDPDDPVNRANRAYERCDYTTKELEKIWFKYNISNDDNPLASWIDNPLAELPTENPWYSIWPDSPLIDY